MKPLPEPVVQPPEAVMSAEHVAIAQALRRARARDAAGEVADVLARFHPNFERQRFFYLAGLTE